MQSRVGLRKHHTNKASGSDGIPAELFQILKDDAEKVLDSIKHRNGIDLTEAQDIKKRW